MSSELFQAMAKSIMEGEVAEAKKLAQEVVAQKLDPLTAISEGFVAGLNKVGDEFSCGTMFLPDLVMAGEAMKAAMAVLEPELHQRGAMRPMLGKVVIGTVQGDIHDIGKSIVATMLSASGFQVFDLGNNVAPEKFVDKARAVEADLVGLSALLTTTMARQRDVIKALDVAGLRPPIKVMVGGAPVNRGWVETIGADGYSEDAVGAVAVAKKLVGAAV